MEPATAVSPVEVSHDDSWNHARPREDEERSTEILFDVYADLERTAPAFQFALEICRLQGVSTLAQQLRVAPEPDAVADAYAQRYSDATHRDLTRDGCHRGLYGKSY